MNCPWPIRQAGAHGSCWQTPMWASNWDKLLGVDSRVAVLAPSVLEEGGDKAALRDALTGAETWSTRRRSPSAHLDVASGYRLFNAVRRLAATLAGMAPPPKLFILTRNAQPIDEGDRANPAHAVLWGLGRTLALEHPEFWRRHHRCRRLGATRVDRAVCAGRSARRRRRRPGRVPGRCPPCSTPRAANPRRSIADQAGGRHQPPGDRCHRQRRAVSDPPTRRDGGRDDRRGVPTRGLATRGTGFRAWRRAGPSSSKLLPMRRTKPR